MPNYTTNFNLEKPLTSDYYDVEVQNSNMDAVDTELQNLKTEKADQADLDTTNQNVSQNANDIATLTTQTTALDTNKVDKVSGKDLSTNDYTDAEKSKLSGVEAGANDYTHPATHAASMITQDSTHRFVTDTEKSTWNGKLDATANATSASKLATARTIALSGDAIGSVAFDGSANKTLTVAVKNDSHTHDSRYYTESEIDSKLAAKLNSSSYSASDVLTKLKTVDGSGSGLDADKLDGVQGSSFLRSDVADIKTAGALTLNDNVELRVGTGADLKIKHNGTSNFISTQSGNIYFQSADYTESMLQLIKDGGINLFYNGSKKFETTSAGAKVTGDLVVTGALTNNGNTVLTDATTTLIDTTIWAKALSFTL